LSSTDSKAAASLLVDYFNDLGGFQRVHPRKLAAPEMGKMALGSGETAQVFTVSR
jgi:hypothetical protein